MFEKKVQQIVEYLKESTLQITLYPAIVRGAFTLDQD